MSHHCKIMCLNHAYKESCFRKPICKNWFHLYIRMSICWSFRQRSQLSADDSRWASKEPAHMLPFHTSYLSISHTAVVLCMCVCVVCLHERQIREGDKAGERRREKGKNSERGEKSNYVYVIEWCCRSAVRDSDQ